MTEDVTGRRMLEFFPIWKFKEGKTCSRGMNERNANLYGAKEDLECLMRNQVKVWT